MDQANAGGREPLVHAPEASLQTRASLAHAHAQRHRDHLLGAGSRRTISRLVCRCVWCTCTSTRSVTVVGGLRAGSPVSTEHVAGHADAHAARWQVQHAGRNRSSRRAWQQQLRCGGEGVVWCTPRARRGRARPRHRDRLKLVVFVGKLAAYAGVRGVVGRRARLGRAAGRIGGQLGRTGLGQQRLLEAHLDGRERCAATARSPDTRIRTSLGIVLVFVVAHEHPYPVRAGSETQGCGGSASWRRSSSNEHWAFGYCETL